LRHLVGRRDAFAERLAMRHGDAVRQTRLRCGHTQRPGERLTRAHRVARGHDLPPDADVMLREWPLAHRYGEPSPFAEGDLSALPDICALYTGE